MPNNNYSALATAQITLTDTTDASYLSGNLMVINSSRNQIYLTGQDGDTRFSPNWKTNNLVIRPFLTASQITKGTDPSKYNPDIFDPEEYQTFELRNNLKIINDIHWYVKDSSGTEKEIASNDSDYSFEWIYTINNERVVIGDRRQLVIKNNILQANSSIEIVCKFSFYDQYAKMTIPQQYTISVINIVAGEGANKSYITSINGNAIYNGSPKYLELQSGYYRNSSLVPLETLQTEIETVEKQTMIKWFIRDMNETTYWKYLDPTTQNENNLNTENEGKLYEVCKIDYSNQEAITLTTNSKGGVVLRVYPDLISGSDIIKLVVSDNGSEFSDLIILYDNSDPTRVSIYSTAGDKIIKNSDNVGTVLKAIITYNGVLLDENNSSHLAMYNNNFDYYWYKTSEDGNRVWNIWTEEENGMTVYHEQEITNATNDITLHKGSKQIYIGPENIDKKNDFTLDLVDKQSVVAASAKSVLLNNLLLSEDELINASIINNNAGIDSLNMDETLATAYEIKAFTLGKNN